MNAKPKPLIVSAVVSDGKVRIVDDFGYRVRSKKAAALWGDGAALKIRIELEEDAIYHGQRKHLHGHLLKPTSDVTGYTVPELKAEWRARFLPEDWMTSTEDMNREQYAEFIRAVEQAIQEEYPTQCWDACLNAMALSDHRRRA